MVSPRVQSGKLPGVDYQRRPDAAKVIENFKISNADAAGMVAEVDLNGKSIEDTVAAWMETNKGTWSTWIK